MQSVAYFAIVVRDYDEAIAFYRDKLGFNLIEDTYMASQDKRWVIMSPRGNTGSAFLLARASKPEQIKSVGNQSGGRVFIFLHTDDFYGDYNDYKARGIEFIEEPRMESYGTVAVFKDLYGNLWDLIQPKVT